MEFVPSEENLVNFITKPLACVSSFLEPFSLRGSVGVFGLMTIDYIPTDENLADFFTKPLLHTEFIEVCKQLGLHQ